MIVDELHYHLIVWGCWTTRDEWMRATPIQSIGIKHILVWEGIGNSPTNKTIYISLPLPIYPSIYEIYLRETGYGEISTPLYEYSPSWIGALFRPTVKPSNSQAVNTLRNPIHGGIDFGWGAPCPQSRDRGANSTRRQPGLTNIQWHWGKGLHQILQGLDEHATLHDEFEGDGWHDES